MSNENKLYAVRTYVRLIRPARGLSCLCVFFFFCCCRSPSPTLNYGPLTTWLNLSVPEVKGRMNDLYGGAQPVEVFTYLGVVEPRPLILMVAGNSYNRRTPIDARHELCVTFSLLGGYTRAVINEYDAAGFLVSEDVIIPEPGPKNYPQWRPGEPIFTRPK